MQIAYYCRVWLPLISLAAASILVCRVWRYRAKPLAATLMAGMMILGGWSLAVFMEQISIEFAAQVFWAKLAATFTAFLPSAWLLFALFYNEKIKTARPLTLAILSFIPVLVTGAVWTNDAFHLMWQSVWWNTSVSPPVIGYTGNIFSQVYTYFSGAMLFLVSGSFAVSFLRAPAKYMKYIGTFMIALTILWIPSVLDIAGCGSFLNMDIGLPAYALAGALISRTIPGSRLPDRQTRPDMKYKNLLSGLTVFETEAASTESKHSGFRVPDIELPETSDHFYSDYYPDNGINLN